MNEEQLQLLYDSYANKQGFKDYGEFKSLMGNDSSRKEFFNSSNKTLGFKDYNEFNSLLKKKDNLESSGATPQEVSPTPITPRKSLLGTESQKKQSAWDTSVGKSKDVTLGGFKLNKPQKAPKINLNTLDVDQLLALDKGKEVTHMAPSVNTAFAGGFSKTKMSPELRPQFDNFIKENYSTAIQKIKPYVLKKEDLSSIEDDYEEAKNGGGFFEGVKAGLTGIKDYLGWGEQEKTGKLDFKPLDDLRKEVRDEAISNKETLLPGQIEYRVKQKFIEKRTSDIYLSKMNLGKENLTPAEQYSLGINKAQEASHLSKENKEKTKNYYQTLSASKSLADDREQLVKEYKEMKANKTPIPQEYIDRYKDNETDITLNLELSKKYRSEINKNQKDIGTIEQEINAYTSQNNEMVDFVERIQGYGYGLMGGIHEFAAKYIDKPLAIVSAATIPSSYIAGLEKSDLGYAKEYEEKAKDIREGKESKVKGQRIGGLMKSADLSSDLTLANLNNWTNATLETVGDNTGMTLALLAGGEVGLGATVLESTGAKVKEIREENEEFKKTRDKAVKNKEAKFEFNGQKYDTKEYKDKDLHSEVASYLVPVAWGSTMILPMAKQLKFLQNESRILASIERGSPALLQKSKEIVFRDGIKKYIGHSLGLAKDLKIMSLSQGGLDMTLGKEVDLFKIATNFDDVRLAFVLHAMNSGYAHVLGQVARPYMTNEEAKVVDTNSRLMTDLSNRMKSKDLTPESKVLVKKQLDRLKEESQVHIDNVIDRMADMSKADYSQVIDLAKKSSEFRQEAMDIQNNTEFSKEGKQAALDKVKKDYIDNEKKLRGVRENYTRRTDGFYGLSERDAAKYYKQAEAELEGKQSSNRDKKLKAQEIWSREESAKEEAARPKEEEVVTPTEESITKEQEDFRLSFNDTPEVTAEKIRKSKEAEVKLTEEAKPKGTEDVISEPIDLEVSDIESKKAEIERLEYVRDNQQPLKPLIFEDQYSKEELDNIQKKYQRDVKEHIGDINKQIAQKQVELKSLEEVKIEEPTPPKTRKGYKEKLVEEVKPIVEAKVENSKVDLLGDRKTQWMNEVSLDELKAHKQGMTSQNIYSIEDALIPKKVRGKNIGSQFDRAIAEGRITPEEAVKIINSAGKEAPESITKLVKEVKSTEEVKVETKEKEKKVSLPKVIDDSNFDEVVAKLMKDGKLTKPC